MIPRCIREPLSSHGAIQSGMAPAGFGRFIVAEAAKWAQIVKAPGAKVD